MKNILCTIICLLLLTTVYSQDEQEKIRELYIGFTFAPQAITTFDNDPPFQVGAPLYLGPTMLIDDLGISPFYNFGGNSIGVFLTYQVTPQFGTYLVLDQSVNSNFGIYGLGFTTPLYKSYIQGFVEIGGSYGDNPEAALLTGMYFNFGKLIKKW